MPEMFGGMSHRLCNGYLPNQMLRHIQYGHREKVLTSKTIWICASCYTCSVRCPNNIDIAKIMDTLRGLALRSGIEAGEKDIPLFHSVFLDTIKSKGRIHELSLIIQLNRRLKIFSRTPDWGGRCFAKGRSNSFPRDLEGERKFKRFQ